MEIKYSIIIPHHNIPQLLRRCLLSIPKKDYIQVIVIDDNSAKEYKDELVSISNEFNNVEFIFSKSGNGAGAARNIGLEKAKGKWVLFVDADDYLLNTTEDLLDKYYDSAADIVYFNVESVDSDTLKPSNRHLPKTANFNRFRQYPSKLKTWLRYEYTEPWGKMIRLDLIKSNNISFFESIVANDYFFSVKSGHCANSIDYDLSAFYCVTERRGSLCNMMFDSTIKIKSRIVAYKYVEDYLESVGVTLYPCSVLVTRFLWGNLAHLFYNYQMLRELGFNHCDILFRIPCRFIRNCPKKICGKFNLPYLCYKAE